MLADSRPDGSAFVVFGRAGQRTVRVPPPPSRGLRIDAAGRTTDFGFNVACAGDVNGDGRDDVLLGAPEKVLAGRPAGAAYVVFGRRSGGTVRLDALGPGGFTVLPPLGAGATGGTGAGRSVAGLGDVNGDGRADFGVGASGATNLNGWFGSVFVVFGRAGSSTVDLARLDRNRGYRIDGGDDGQRVGGSLAPAGDVNGDGLPDLVLGTLGGFANGGAYVVYGKRPSANVNLMSLGTQGFAMRGARTQREQISDGAGFAVSAAGDVNGDRLGDIVVGAPSTATPTGRRAGRATVVFGARTSGAVNLVAPGSRGFRIIGKIERGPLLCGSGDCDRGSQLGSSVAPTGDINADGLDDLALGAPGEQDDRGATYIIYGRRSTSTLATAHLGRAGTRLAGRRPADFFGTSLATTWKLGAGPPGLLIGATPRTDRFGDVYLLQKGGR